MPMNKMARPQNCIERSGDLRRRGEVVPVVDAAMYQSGGLLVVVDSVGTESANGHAEDAFQVALGDIAVVDDAL
jgi:hypothetical protein